MTTKKCRACGKKTNLVIALGGVLLCRDECHPSIEAEIRTLREEGKPVDVTALAWERYSRRHPQK